MLMVFPFFLLRAPSFMFLFSHKKLYFIYVFFFWYLKCFVLLSVCLLLLIDLFSNFAESVCSCHGNIKSINLSSLKPELMKPEEDRIPTVQLQLQSRIKVTHRGVTLYSLLGATVLVCRC